MSYMRFGDDSDVHCYQGGGMTVVDIAGSRVIRDSSETVEPDGDEMASLNLQTKPIDLKYAGESFSFAAMKDAIVFLRELSELGYRVPEAGMQALGRAISEIRIPPKGAMLNLDDSDTTQVVCFRKKDLTSPYAIMVDLKKMPEGVDEDKLNISELMEMEFDRIDLPHAGEIFEFKDRDSMIEKMLELRAIGYEVSESYLEKAKRF